MRLKNIINKIFKVVTPIALVFLCCICTLTYVRQTKEIKLASRTTAVTTSATTDIPVVIAVPEDKMMLPNGKINPYYKPPEYTTKEFTTMKFDDYTYQTPHYETNKYDY